MFKWSYTVSNDVQLTELQVVQAIMCCNQQQLTHRQLHCNLVQGFKGALASAKKACVHCEMQQDKLSPPLRKQNQHE